MRPTRESVIAVLIAAFLVVQLAVPVVALFGPRPSRFAWQMYSALPPVPEAWAIDADGNETAIELGTLFAVQRAEIDYEAVLRSGLCDTVEAAAIRIVGLADGRSETIRCD